MKLTLTLTTDEILKSAERFQAERMPTRESIEANRQHEYRMREYRREVAEEKQANYIKDTPTIRYHI